MSNPVWLAMVMWLGAVVMPATAAETRLEGVSGPFAWRAADLRRGREPIDGKEQDVYWFTLTLRENAGRAWTLERYEARGRRPGWSEARVDDAGPWPMRPRGERSFRLGSSAACQASTPCTSSDPMQWSIVLIGTDDGGRPFRTTVEVALPPESALPPGPPARSVRALTPAAAAGGVSVPIDVKNRLIKVTASLGGQPVTLVLDTGAQLTMLTPEAARRAGLTASAETSRRTVVLAAGEEANLTLSVAPPLRLGDFVVENLEVGIAPLTGFIGIVGHVDGLLGYDVLELFTFTVDARSGRLKLELAR